MRYQRLPFLGLLAVAFNNISQAFVQQTRLPRSSFNRHPRLLTSNYYERCAVTTKATSPENTVLAEVHRKETKALLLQELSQQNNDPMHPKVQAVLTELAELNPSEHIGEVSLLKALQGTWITLSRTEFPGESGASSTGFTQYTLGRMSFGKFAPKDLMCYFQEITQTITNMSSDKNHLAKLSAPGFEYLSMSTDVRFTIEDGPCKGVAGTLSTSGFCTPDNDHRGRLKVWFSAGAMHPTYPHERDNEGRWSDDEERWNSFFLKAPALPDSADVHYEGNCKYFLIEPQEGYLDIIYLDDELRVTKGNYGSIVVMLRM